MTPIRITTGLALAAALAACAQAPTQPATPAALDCAALEAETDAAAQAQRVAAQQQHDAWKAVVPFAVVARYGKGKATATESEQRLDALQQHATLRGCAIPTH